MGHAVDRRAVGLEQRQDRLDVQAGRRHQRIDQLDPAVQLQIGRLTGAVVDAAHQRVAVGMRAGGGDADQHVAGGHAGAVLHFALLDAGDGEAGQVVFARGIHVGHFGGFTTDQRATGLGAAVGNAADHGRSGVDVELAGGEVIQEEQRLGALDQDVVDAHGDQIDADGVVAAQLLCELQLGADAVGTGHQDRLAVLVGEVEQRAEATQPAHDFRTEAALYQRLDTLDQFVACVDVDTGVTIGKGRVRRGRGAGHGRLHWRGERGILTGHVGAKAPFGQQFPLEPPSNGIFNASQPGHNPVFGALHACFYGTGAVRRTHRRRCRQRQWYL
ncbi:hypothetical protein D3C71_1190700 [compost metagenome]